MSAVEQSIQLQIQDIAAVKQAFSASLAERQPDTLWWLVDSSEDIPYENRVKGTNILAVDQNVDNVNIASLYSDWFNLQNAYFSQDQPITVPSGVTSLKTAIEIYYRWRVSQYFNDIMSVAGGQGVSPQYVFPYPDFNLGTYPIGGSFQKGNGPVTATGPGILGVIPLNANTTADATLSITAVYPILPPSTLSPPSPPPPPASPVVFSATVPSGSLAGVPVDVGGQALRVAYTPDTVGSVTVEAVAGFAIGYPVVIAENTIPSNPDTALPVWKTEVAVVLNIAGLVLTLGQQALSGATSPPTPGLRNGYTMAAKVYPLFSDVTAVTGGGTDDLQIGFFPDWGEGFVDITSIVAPPVEGRSRDTKEDTESESQSSSPPPPPSLSSRSSLHQKPSQYPSSPKSPLSS